MKCVICKSGMAKKAKITVTFERKKMIVILKGVPARVCANCGEEYLDDSTTEQIMRQAEKIYKNGVELTVQHYIAA